MSKSVMRNLNLFVIVARNLCPHRWWQLSRGEAEGLQCQNNNSEFRKFIEGVIQIVLEDNLNLCNFFEQSLFKKVEHL